MNASKRAARSNTSRDKTTVQPSYTTSVERDYISDTASFRLSQDMFGDLTTVTLGFADTRNKSR